MAHFQKITQSSLAKFLKCRRAYCFKYELGIVREPSTALRFGVAMHKAIEGWHRGGDYHEIVEQATEDWAAWISTAQTPEIQYERQVELAKLRAMFAGYCRRWGEVGLEFVAIELPFDIDLLNPDTRWASKTFRHAGKIDAIVKFEDGRLAVFETKTTIEEIGQDAEYWQRLRLDVQISTYMLAAQRLGYNVQTIVYDVIRKPQIIPLLIDDLDPDGLKIVVTADGERVKLDNGKWRQSPDAAKGWTKLSRRQTANEYQHRLEEDIALRPEFYFQRREVPRLADDLEECRSLLWDVAKDIRNAQLTGRHYRNVDACKSPFPCEYIPLCYGNVDIALGLPEGFKQIENRHPELENTNGNGNSIAPTTSEVGATTPPAAACV